VANEGSGTISVIDVATNTITKTICLGSDPAIPGTPQPPGPCNAEADHHKPFYNGHVGVHGLWLTPDGGVLLATNRISGTVVAISTATNEVLGYAPVGREPHLATVTPDGKYAWVAVRGESQIDVLKLDNLFTPGLPRTARMKNEGSIATALGPSMVSFTPDGKFAFVAAGKQNRVDKIDTGSRKLVASQTVTPLFTPFGLVTPDGQELYLVHKIAGTLSILRTSDLGFVVQDLPIGAGANHVAFLDNYAYITVAGGGGKIVVMNRTTHAIERELTGLGGSPHGIWATPDKRLYVGLETGPMVTVINPQPLLDPLLSLSVSLDAVRSLIQFTEVTDANIKQPIDIVIKP
jgi:YVTN family beta-propeller protein